MLIQINIKNINNNKQVKNVNMKMLIKILYVIFIFFKILYIYKIYLKFLFNFNVIRNIQNIDLS